jgi:hypothetical protein
MDIERLELMANSDKSVYPTLVREYERRNEYEKALDFLLWRDSTAYKELVKKLILDGHKYELLGLNSLANLITENYTYGRMHLIIYGKTQVLKTTPTTACKNIFEKWLSMIFPNHKKTVMEFMDASFTMRELDLLERFLIHKTDMIFSDRNIICTYYRSKNDTLTIPELNIVEATILGLIFSKYSRNREILGLYLDYFLGI